MSGAGLDTFAANTSWYSRSAFGNLSSCVGMLGSDLSLESCLPLGVRGLDDDEEVVGVVVADDSGLDKDDRDEDGDRVDVGDRDAVDDGGVYVV